MQRPNEVRPDICVIGTDRAGFDIAFAAAGLGAPVVLVTQAEAGSLTDEDRHALSRLAALGTRILHGVGAFSDRNRFSFGEVAIAARRFVVATGTVSDTPALPGLAKGDIHSWDGTTKARHVAIFGSGPQTLVTAQGARFQGGNASIFSAGEILPGFDREAVGVLTSILRRAGISIHDNAAYRLERGAEGITIEREGSAPIRASHVVLEPQARPDLDHLALDAAGVKMSEGRLVLSPSLRTSNRRVYAAGRVTMRPGAAEHAAHHAGTVLAEILFRKASPVEAASEVRLARTRPALAEAGIGEADIADRLRANHRFYRVSLAETAIGGPGFIKLIADRKNHILGYVILAPAAAELAAFFTLAIRHAVPVEQLGGIPLAYPSHAEVIGRLASLALKERIASPAAKRMIRFLRIFG